MQIFWLQIHSQSRRNHGANLAELESKPVPKKGVLDCPLPRFSDFPAVCFLYKEYPKSYKYWQSVLWLIETCKYYVIFLLSIVSFFVFLSVCKNCQNGNFLLKVDYFSDRIPCSASFSWIIMMTSPLLTNMNFSCRNSGRKRPLKRHRLHRKYQT